MPEMVPQHKFSTEAKLLLIPILDKTEIVETNSL